MAMVTEVKWIKIDTDIFNDEKIRLIDAMPEADAIINIWFRLLTLAGKTNDSGLIYLQRNLPYTPEMLAAIINRKQTIVDLALHTFEMYGMITYDQDGAIELTNWEKHQNIDGLEKVKLQNKERQQKYRDRKKQERLLETLDSDDKNKRNVTHNVSITQDNALEQEEDKEEELLVNKLIPKRAQQRISEILKNRDIDPEKIEIATKLVGRLVEINNNVDESLSLLDYAIALANAKGEAVTNKWRYAMGVMKTWNGKNIHTYTEAIAYVSKSPAANVGVPITMSEAPEIPMDIDIANTDWDKF
jgi:predicted phage replisome organizer